MSGLADPQDVRAILVGAARAGTALTYSEVLEALGYGFSRPKMRALCALLTHVDEDAEMRGEPELAILVVRQSDGIPGQGWWISGARKHDHQGLWEGPDAARLIRDVQERTFAYWRERPA